MTPCEFISTSTVVAAPPLVPEIILHLATEVTPLWQATEVELDRHNLPPPYWAFAWPGGQAVSRYVLDNPALVRDRRVLDFAAGSGVIAIAARQAGAASVVAVEIDAYAAAVIAMNATLNGAAFPDGGIKVRCEDLVGDALDGIDVVLAGDVCYERPMAERVTAWFRALAGAGKTVIIGDPGRSYLPGDGLCELARYVVPTSLDLEDRVSRETRVLRIAAA
ncbi:MAG: 50S ribosomal protein L11 methyltransferase [Azospirillaceae bacterium]|nr:50S ribosomal protein L11 methyltransferase [Azospirillaceae bacterium]